MARSIRGSDGEFVTARDVMSDEDFAAEVDGWRQALLEANDADDLDGASHIRRRLAELGATSSRLGRVS